jgi:hypothetical protein
MNYYNIIVLPWLFMQPILNSVWTYALAEGYIYCALFQWQESYTTMGFQFPNCVHQTWWHYTQDGCYWFQDFRFYRLLCKSHTYLYNCATLVHHSLLTTVHNVAPICQLHTKKQSHLFIDHEVVWQVEFDYVVTVLKESLKDYDITWTKLSW